MTPRPLPKTVAPLPDELLSGWLSRLAAANYCDDAELLAHIEIDTRHGAALDFDVEAADAEKISIAARVDPDTVQSMTFTAMTKMEMMLTAQVPFSLAPSVPDAASRSGIGGDSGHLIANFAAASLSVIFFFRQSSPNAANPI